MKLKRRVVVFPAALLLVASVQGSSALAREVDWVTEPLLDASLFGGVLAMDVTNSSSEGMAHFPTQGFDERARDDLHGRSRSLSVTPAESRADLESNVAVAGLIATTAGMGVLGQQETAVSNGMTILHTFAISNFSTTVLKYSIRRKRPKESSFPNEMGSNVDNTVSFPSAHTANAFAAATIFSLLRPDAHWAVRSSFFLLAGFVGWARIAADRHYLTDVLAGATIGAGSAGLAWWTFEGKDKNRIEVAANPGELKITWRF